MLLNLYYLVEVEDDREHTQIGFLAAASATDREFDAEKMEASFRQQFDGVMFTVGQPIIFHYESKNLLGNIRKVENVDLHSFDKKSSQPGGRSGKRHV